MLNISSFYLKKMNNFLAVLNNSLNLFYTHTLYFHSLQFNVMESFL